MNRAETQIPVSRTHRWHNVDKRGMAYEGELLTLEYKEEDREEIAAWLHALAKAVEEEA